MHLEVRGGKEGKKGGEVGEKGLGRRLTSRLNKVFKGMKDHRIHCKELSHELEIPSFSLDLPYSLR